MINAQLEAPLKTQTTPRPQAVVHVAGVVTIDGSVAPRLGRARIESAQKRTLRIGDPLIQIAHHVVDPVTSPCAHTTLSGPGETQQWALLVVGKIEAWVQVIFR